MPAGATGGPNIDQVVFDFNEADVGTPAFNFAIEGEALTIVDADGDTYGNPDVAVQACEAPQGFVADDSAGDTAA